MPVCLGALILLYLASASSWRSPQNWRHWATHAYLWTSGTESREEFARQFATPSVGYSFGTSEHVGNWLREHTTAADYVAVRGFQPEIYAVSQRRYPGRFFWTTFIVSPARAYRRAEWLAEDGAVLDAHPPKYVVALTGIADGPDSVGFFQRRGYQTVEVIRQFTIMQRPAGVAQGAH